jgi:ATP-binding cassette, subfamily C, bacterial CydCD
MKAVHPGLSRYTRATRPYLALLVALGVASAAVVIAQAWLLATIVAGAFTHGRDLDEMRGLVCALAAVVAARAVVAWFPDMAGHRASASVKSQLRTLLVTRAADPGADGRSAGGAGELAVLATTGIDALDDYYARYLPQVVLAGIVPVAVIAVIASADWISAALIVVTLPLIPVFMVLIGKATKKNADHRLAALRTLSGHFLDVVTGLTTLKIFGRSRAQSATIHAVTDEYRRTTDATLRVAFLSSLVLELVASVSLALVAVSVGLRVLDSHLGLGTALFVLVLAPEAFAPLRQLGANYHASADGLSAADHVFRMLDRPPARNGTRRDVPDPATHGLVVSDVVVWYPDRAEPALAGTSLSIDPGEIVALVGPSGSGKSTLLSVLVGLVVPDQGSVAIGGVDLACVDPDAWRKHVAWVPQHPHVFARSIGENVRIGRPDATSAELFRAICDAGLDGVVASAPDGLGTPLGDRGMGLSAGERQRVALARAFLRDAPLLLLDEPTASIDGETEAELLDVVRRLAYGRTVVIAAHRPTLIDFADRVISLERAEVLA